MATPHWYPKAILTSFSGTGPDIHVGTFKLILLTSAYTPDQVNHQFRSDLGANEASGGTGYPAGGFTLTSVTFTQSSLVLNWAAGNISQAITGGPLTFEYGVFYKSLGGASSADPLLGYVDFGGQSITGATLTITLTNPLTITAS